MPITSYVSTPKLEDYKKQFEEHLFMERKNGILQVRLSTHGGPFVWSFEAHQALAEAWTAIGHDPDNEVLILTATDPYWIGEFDHESFDQLEEDPNDDTRYNATYHDATKLVENWVNDIDIPTISVINGPGLHTEFALMADITLCAPDVVIRDDHFGDATVPGDAQSLVFQAVLGIKRASYMMFMAEGIDAQTALDWGLLNEVLPKESLLPRAWEIAGKIMKQPRTVRRLTHQLTVRPWKRLIMNDYQVHIGLEMYGNAHIKTKHHFDQIKSRWTEREKNR